MAKADTHNDDKDALSWYRSNFTAKGMSNEIAGADTLRHLFVLMLGLGMRESRGHHCEGPMLLLLAALAVLPTRLRRVCSRCPGTHTTRRRKSTS